MKLHILDQTFIKDVEASDFRTCDDTGANSNALYIWNKVRVHVGLAPLRFDQLPDFCAVHLTYHEIRKDYGCKRKADSCVMDEPVAPAKAEARPVQQAVRPNSSPIQPEEF